MRRIGTVVTLGLLAASPARADRPTEPPVQVEVGLNTRRFVASGDAQTAFRGEVDPADEAHSAVTLGMRFTSWMAWNTYVGAEGEVGRLDSLSGSNLAGAYGLAGVRGDLGWTTVSVELAAGRRTVRYSLDSDDQGKWIAEPRVRAQFWAGPRVTIGAAVGATLADQSVWMAGVYVGVHSLVYGSGQP